MYICLCQAITEAQVRQAVAEGVVDAQQLGEVLGVGVNCGTCLEAAQALVDSCAANKLAYAA